MIGPDHSVNAALIIIADFVLEALISKDLNPSLCRCQALERDSPDSLPIVPNIAVTEEGGRC